MALIRREQAGATVVLSFSRPPVNAFNAQLVQELAAMLQDVAADPPAGGLVLSGDGGVFSAGIDLKEAPGYSERQAARATADINRALRTLYALPTATVAAVDGHAIGGGFVMMLACDARIAADGPAKLALTQVRTSIAYPEVPLEIVAAELDPGLRRQLMLSGEAIAPAVALERGVIDELHTREELFARAVQLARSRAAAPSYAAVKVQLRRATLARLEAIAAG